MKSANILDLFPGIRESARGRLPSPHEKKAYWRSRRSTIIRSAVMAERFAYSHRQERYDTEGRPRLLHRSRIARYGTAMLGCRTAPTDVERFVITVGANFKLRPGDGELIQYHPVDKWKMCSEPEAALQAFSYPARCDELFGFALFSDNMQPEDVSGIYCNIQHPCSDCREFLFPFLDRSAPVLLVRHALPCDPYPHPTAVYEPDPFGDGMLLVEEWTFGSILEHHGNRIGRRAP